MCCKKVSIVSITVALFFSVIISMVSAASMPAPNLEALQQEAEAMQDSANQLQRARRDIVVLVSLSMPKASLQQWIADASRVGAVIELRGLVNQSFQDTTQHVLALSPHQGAAWQINPEDFERYSITAVPAVVVRNPQQPTQFDRVQGDGTLEAALSRIAQEGEEKQRAQQMLLALRETNR